MMPALDVWQAFVVIVFFAWALPGIHFWTISKSLAVGIMWPLYFIAMLMWEK